MTETITGVALLTSDGRVVALPRPHRHHHLYATCALLGIDPDHAGHDSGFMTSMGRFVGREVAMWIVVAAGQPYRHSGSPGDPKLYSEDVW